MNMVRAGTVSHPSEWVHSGYHEIQSPPIRYALINRNRLVELNGLRDEAQLRSLHKKWIDQAVSGGSSSRQSKWSQAVSVGNESFVEQMKRELGFSAIGMQEHAGWK